MSPLASESDSQDEQDILTRAEAQQLIDASEDRDGWYRDRRLIRYAFDRLCNELRDPDSPARYGLWPAQNISGEKVDWNGNFDIVDGKILFHNSFAFFIKKHILPEDSMTHYIISWLEAWGVLTIRRALRRAIIYYSRARDVVSMDCEEDLKRTMAWMKSTAHELRTSEVIWCAVDLISMRYRRAFERQYGLLFDARALIKVEVDRAIEERSKLPNRHPAMMLNEWRAKRVVEIYTRPTSTGSLDCIIDVAFESDKDLMPYIHDIDSTGAKNRAKIQKSQDSLRPGINTPWKQICQIYAEYDKSSHRAGWDKCWTKRCARAWTDATSKPIEVPKAKEQAEQIDLEELQALLKSDPSTSDSQVKPISKAQPKGKKTKAKRKAIRKAPKSSHVVKLHNSDDAKGEADENMTADCEVAVSNPYEVLQMQSLSFSTAVSKNQQNAGSKSEESAKSAFPSDFEGWQSVQGRKDQRPKKPECKKAEGEVHEDRKHADKKYEGTQDRPKSKPLLETQRTKPESIEKATTPLSLSPTPVAPWANFSSVENKPRREETANGSTDAKLGAATDRSKAVHNRRDSAVSCVDRESIVAAPHSAAGVAETNGFGPARPNQDISLVKAWLSYKYALAHTGLSERELQASRWQPPPPPKGSHRRRREKSGKKGGRCLLIRFGHV